LKKQAGEDATDAHRLPLMLFLFICAILFICVICGSLATVLYGKGLPFRIPSLPCGFRGCFPKTNHGRRGIHTEKDCRSASPPFRVISVAGRLVRCRAPILGLGLQYR
jgi:hypothetical protein